MKQSQSRAKPSKAYSVMLPIADESENGSETAQAIFSLHSLGIATQREDHAYGFGKAQLSDAMRLRETRFMESCIRQALYRPYSTRFVYFDDAWTEQPDRQRRIFPTPESEQENNVIASSAPGSKTPFMALASRYITDVHLAGSGATTRCFPFYSYDEDGTHRRENITDWALDQFRSHYNNPVISKWSIFDYVYGILHHPGYRGAFADDLKRELPRIPFAPDFRAFQRAGQQLIRLHLDYDKLEPWDLPHIESASVPLSAHVKKMRFSKDKTSLLVNESLTLGGIPPAVFDYRVGKCSALEWVIDQYQVTANKRTNAVLDPNRQDDPKYIIGLVGQIVRMSVETVQIIDALPSEFGTQAAEKVPT